MKNSFKSFLIFLFLALFFSGAAVAQPIPLTPSGVQPSVYKIMAYQDGVKQWSGTGWMVAEGKMMTAGHVCDDEGELGFTFRAFNKWNQSYPVKVIRFSHDPDLCIMDAKNVPGTPLSLTLPPSYGSTVWYVGAPLGIYGDGVAPFAQGFYIGHNMCMIAGYPGASGSPMFTEDGVFGVLVAGWRGTELIEVESFFSIAEFLSEK